MYSKVLESLERLGQDASDNLLFHATRPAVPHNICSAALVHEAEGNVKFVAGHPGAPDSQDVGVFGERHESGFSMQQIERTWGEGVQVEYFQCTGDSIGQVGRTVIVDWTIGC